MMRTAGWKLLVLSFAYLASAQVLKKCSAPPEYPHTTLGKKYSGRKTFDAGEKIYYSCAEDFTPYKGLRTVQCSDGTWTKLTLKCEKKSCGNVGDLPNGQFEYEGNSYLGEKVYAVCNSGYTLKGPNYMVCKKSGWTGEFPTCEEGETTCSSPTVADSLSPSGQTVQVGGSVNFTCVDGFQLDGARQISCGPDGQWKPLPPRCLPTYAPTKVPNKELRCRVPAAMGNSNLADRYITMKSFASGSRVQYVCDVGYTQAGGSRYRTCVNGKWAPLYLRCEQGETTCSSPTVADSLSPSGQTVQVGGSVNFTCVDGFQLDGAQQISCGPDGQWKPLPPRCLPTYAPTKVPNKELRCRVPAAMGNSNLADRYITMKSFASGARVQYVCDVGYTQAGGSRYRTCVNGKWTPLYLRCERKLCGSAGDILNGEFVYTGAQFGDTATAVCNEGYLLVGRPTRKCMSQGWDGRIPACEAVDCGEPPKVANGEIKGSRELSYTYRSVVRYHCQVGILTGPNEVWCTQDGTWSTLPTCEDVRCPPPDVAGAIWSGASRAFYNPRDTIAIGCKQGYTATGPSVAICGSDGRWSPGLPWCAPTARSGR